MNSREENESSHKFLVPEIVQRSRNVVLLKKKADKCSPEVENVFQSKSRFYEKVTKKNDVISEECSAYAQHEKSFGKKQSSVINNFAEILKKGGQFKRKDETDTTELADSLGLSLNKLDVMANAILNSFHTLDVENVRRDIADLDNKIREQIIISDKLSAAQLSTAALRIAMPAKEKGNKIIRLQEEHKKLLKEAQRLETDVNELELYLEKED